ncbi:hypothetical protein ACHAXA_010118 [Cyclostephanos tholiformis]|uniref:GTP diphosphokinase n=1 Tax=Cyclostephanos tholiformis TaxID=382380 RepID=A0ABD3RXM9_9STRA
MIADDITLPRGSRGSRGDVDVDVDGWHAITSPPPGEGEMDDDDVELAGRPWEGEEHELPERRRPRRKRRRRRRRGMGGGGTVMSLPLVCVVVVVSRNAVVHAALCHPRPMTTIVTRINDRTGVGSGGRSMTSSSSSRSRRKTRIGEKTSESLDFVVGGRFLRRSGAGGGFFSCRCYCPPTPPLALLSSSSSSSSAFADGGGVDGVDDGTFRGIFRSGSFSIGGGGGGGGGVMGGGTPSATSSSLSSSSTSSLTSSSLTSSSSSSTSPMPSSPPLPRGFSYVDDDNDEQLDEYHVASNDDDGPTRLGYGVSYGGGYRNGNSRNDNVDGHGDMGSEPSDADADDDGNDYDVVDGWGGGLSTTYEDPEIDGSVIANGSTGWGLYAPEVNKWTTLMADGTNAAIHRPGREMTLEEGMEILYNDLKDLSADDYVKIEEYWDRLLPTLTYLGRDARRQVKQALCVAYRAHRSQVRKSGEPFIIHPVEVALLLSGMKMDASTVMSGLLHDTVEDTDLTFEQVEAMFGREVRNIVEGETKVSKLPKLAFADYADEQAENLRQMFIAMTDDYRIIIVKLADRLHNMRTLAHMKPEKQIKISRETLDIFAPLAHRMGLWPFKSELEDIAFMYLYPKEYERLNRRLVQRQLQFGATLDKSIEVLERTLMADPTLRSQDVGIEVVGRTKELYSLWHKMEMKRDRNLDHITDLVALRVILTPGGGGRGGGGAARTNGAGGGVRAQGEADSGVWLCYHVLGLVQHLPGFQPMPTKVKDYISFPKPNGYQSLHTALMCDGQSVEVQIRTSSMHQVAEFGMASHFAYKDTMKRSNAAGVSPSSVASGLYNTPWLSSIKEWQQDTVCSRDFVDCVRRELLGKRVFVFLRNGKILNLSRGATVVDAAFQIHTTVGLQMHGVEINGKPVRVLVPISYVLNNGDVVSILTGEGTPTTEWMKFAKSRSTRSKLRAHFRAKQHDSITKTGESMFFDYLKNHRDEIRRSSYLGYEFDIPLDKSELSRFLPGRSHYTDVDELLFAIGKSHNVSFLRTKVSKIFLVPLKVLEASDKAAITIDTQSVISSQPEESHLLSNSDMPEGGAVEYADSECACRHCLPIRGDAIIGTKGRIADSPTIVHRVECPYAQQAINDAKSGVKGDSVIGDPVKLIWPEAGSWEEWNKETFLVEVVVMANDRKLLLADCSVIASKNSEILKTGSSSTLEHCTLEFLVKVSDLQELQNLMDKMTEVHSVMSVERRFGSELLE